MSNEKITYDVASQSVDGWLPKNSDAEVFTFEFTNLELNELLQSNKPFRLKAKLTQEKKDSIVGQIENDQDKTDSIFGWDSKVWHFDYLQDDYKENVGEHYLQGHIYFVRKDDTEIITPSNYDMKTATWNTITLDYPEIIKNALDLLVTAWEKIDQLESQS